MNLRLLILLLLFSFNAHTQQDPELDVLDQKIGLYERGNEIAKIAFLGIGGIVLSILYSKTYMGNHEFSRTETQVLSAFLATPVIASLTFEFLTKGTKKQRAHIIALNSDPERRFIQQLGQNVDEIILRAPQRRLAASATRAATLPKLSLQHHVPVERAV